MSIGGTHNNAYSFKGYYDDLRIYNRVLNAAELVLLGGNVSIPAVPSTSNLTSRFTFDSTIADAQGALTPTFTGTAQYVTGKVGNAIYFANEANVVNNNSTLVHGPNYISAPFTQTTPLSIAFWMNFTKLPVSTGCYTEVVSIGSTSSTYEGLTFIGNSNGIYLAINASANYTSPYVFSTSQWYHVVLIFNPNSTIQLWVNGSLFSSVACTQSSITASGTCVLSIGEAAYTGSSPNINRPFAGYIDDFRIYNTVITPAQILSLSQKQNLLTQLTFDSTTADAQGTLSAPTVNGTLVYSPNCKVGTASFDCTANSGGGTATNNLTYAVSLPALPITISMWIYQKVTGSTTAVMIGFSAGSTYCTGININTSLCPYVDMYVNGTSCGVGNTVAITNNAWHHITLTVSNVTQLAILYINGQAVASSSVPSTAGASLTGPSVSNIINTLRIGGNPANGFNAFSALIDDFRIYNSALTPSQVAGLYYSSPNTGYVLYQQPIEGQNLADLAWGTSAAVPATVSAWIKNNSTSSNAQQLSLAVNNGNQGLTTWIPFENGSAVDVTGGVTGPAVVGTLSSMISTSTYKVGASSLNLTGNTAGGASFNSVTYTAPSAFTLPLTVSFWYYTSSSGQTQVMFHISSTLTASSIQIAIDGGSSRVYSDCFFSNGTNYQINGITSSAAAQATNAWQHVCCTYTNNGYNVMYLNGIPVVQSIATPSTNALNNSPTLIKLGNTGGSLYTFSGYLDDLRIYNRVLSAAQIQQLYLNNASTTTLTPYLTPRSVLYQTPSLPANSWTKISVTLPGDITGSWASDNTTGLNLALCLGAGSNYSSANIATASNNSSNVWNNALVYASSNQVYGASNSFLTNLGNSILLTGVQLEKGSLATPYEFRPYSVENTLATTSMSNSVVISKLATTTAPGAVQVGSGLTISGGVLSTLSSAFNCYVTGSAMNNNGLNLSMGSVNNGGFAISTYNSIANSAITIPATGTYIISVTVNSPGAAGQQTESVSIKNATTGTVWATASEWIQSGDGMTGVSCSTIVVATSSDQIIFPQTNMNNENNQQITVYRLF